MLTMISRALKQGDPQTVQELYQRSEEQGVISHVVEYPLPGRTIGLTPNKMKFVADNVDTCTITATFSHGELQSGQIVTVQDIPTGAVAFMANLRTSSVSVAPDGTATLTLQTTVAGVYHVRADLAGYAPSFVEVEALP